MVPIAIRIKGFTRENRHEMIDYAVSSISDSSGWVTNHTMYSNKMIVINFEIEMKGIKKLLDLLNQNGIRLFEESRTIAHHFTEDMVKANESKEIMGTVNITFINDEPNIRNDIPAVPG